MGNTCCRSGLGAKVDILEGRQILVFPDVDAFDYWKEKLSEHPRLSGHKKSPF
ncbi:MAG: hypothetical protein IJ753_09055 [Bacteroidales bacterium]|nr:hypothetical protein [Bacteroidales bacterium]